MTTLDLDKRDDETWGQQATRLVYQARLMLADPTKETYHDRLRACIQAMETQMDFWALLARAMEEDDYDE